MSQGFWQLLATIAATMVGLVFVGTYYYLQSGWRTFTFFQTELEELTVGYARVMIAYFSTVLGISVLREPSLPPVLTTAFYAVVGLAAARYTGRLNEALRRQQSLFQLKELDLAVWSSRLWFFVVFIVPHAIFRFQGVSIAAVLREQFLAERSLVWSSLSALLVAYINLLQFLLLPHSFHKRERDEAARLNRGAVLQGKHPPNPTWDNVRALNATERVESALDRLGLALVMNVDTTSTYLSGHTASGEIARPMLHFPPKVSEHGEAMLHLLIPDDWHSDQQLLEQAVLLARLAGVAAIEACRDLAGLDVRIWRRHVQPWSQRTEHDLILRLRWVDEDLLKLREVPATAESVVASASDKLLHASLFPLGFIEDAFDPGERAPKENELFSFYEVKDVSHAMLKRYAAKVLVHKVPSREEVRELIPQMVKKVAKLDCYRNQETRKRWEGKHAQVVWLYVFDEARRPPEMMPLDVMPHYVCQAEWFASGVDPAYAPMPMLHPDEHLGDVRVKWSRRYRDLPQ